MLETVQIRNENSSLDVDRKNSLNKITFIGLLTSFDYSRALLRKLKESGLTDVLDVKDDLIKLRSRIFQIFSRISSILNSFNQDFEIDGCIVNCDFCSDYARTFRDYHAWCKDCYRREYGGNK